MVLVRLHTTSCFSNDLLISSLLQRCDYSSSIEVRGNYISGFDEAIDRRFTEGLAQFYDIPCRELVMLQLQTNCCLGNPRSI